MTVGGIGVDMVGSSDMDAGSEMDVRNEVSRQCSTCPGSDAVLRTGSGREYVLCPASRRASAMQPRFIDPRDRGCPGGWVEVYESRESP